MTTPVTKAANCVALGAAAQVPGATSLLGAGKNDTTGQKVVGAATATSAAKYGKTVAGAASTVEKAGFPELAEATAKAGAKLAKYAPAASKALGIAGAAYMAYDAAHQAYVCYTSK